MSHFQDPSFFPKKKEQFNLQIQYLGLKLFQLIFLAYSFLYLIVYKAQIYRKISSKFFLQEHYHEQAPLIQ